MRKKAVGAEDAGFRFQMPRASPPIQKPYTCKGWEGG